MAATKNFEGDLLQKLINEAVNKRIFGSFPELKDAEGGGEEPPESVINKMAGDIQKHHLFKAAFLASKDDNLALSRLKEMITLAIEEAIGKLKDRLGRVIEKAFTES